MLGSRLLQAFSARLQEFRWSAAFWAHEPVTSHQSRLWLARVRVEKLKKKTSNLVGKIDTMPCSGSIGSGVDEERS